ncbi:hypothetical protein BpHYR1_045121, partial [Brachionus plicatilis]
VSFKKVRERENEITFFNYRKIASLHFYNTLAYAESNKRNSSFKNEGDIGKKLLNSKIYSIDFLRGFGDILHQKIQKRATILPRRCLYFSMCYVQGATIGDLLKRGKIQKNYKLFVPTIFFREKNLS